jgi:hypothetical protein
MKEIKKIVETYAIFAQGVRALNAVSSTIYTYIHTYIQIYIYIYIYMYIYIHIHT